MGTTAPTPLDRRTSDLLLHMTLTKVITAVTSFDFSKQRRLTSVTAALLGTICCFPMAVEAKEEQQTSQGLPGRRVSGASRLPSTACAQDSEPLVAIIPENNLGTTAVAEPTLWLSIPEITSAKQLEFYLFNAQDEIIYQNNFTIAPGADLMGLDLATMTNAPKLEVDQRYRWAASIVCNPDNRSENISVEGWVDRVEGSNTESGRLWYDRLGGVVEQLQRHPYDQNVLSQWRTLIASARLEQIVPLSVNSNSVEITAPRTTDFD